MYQTTRWLFNVDLPRLFHCSTAYYYCSSPLSTYITHIITSCLFITYQYQKPNLFQLLSSAITFDPSFTKIEKTIKKKPAVQYITYASSLVAKPLSAHTKKSIHTSHLNAYSRILICKLANSHSPPSCYLITAPRRSTFIHEMWAHRTLSKHALMLLLLLDACFRACCR